MTSPSLGIAIHMAKDKILFGKGIFYIGGNRGRGQAHHSWPFMGRREVSRDQNPGWLGFIEGL